jgi:hypothetical protein
MRTVFISYDIRAQKRNDTQKKKSSYWRIADYFYAYSTTPARLCNPRAQVQRFLAFCIPAKLRY